MKKIILKRISASAIITITVMTLLFSAISYSRAERDDEGEGDDYRSPAVQTPSESPAIVTPQLVQPVSVPQDNIVLTPIVINAPTRPDNSLLLASLKDSDHDGIVDRLDKHPGEDDFAYSLIDNNQNGIADDLEILLK